MLFKWIDHPSFRKHEQMMAILYEMGMADKQQLAVVTGWSLRTIRWTIEKIRSKGATPEEKDEWVRSIPIRKRTSPREVVYALGRMGIRYVQDMMEEQPHARTAPEAQVKHFLGINDILIRVMEKVPREDLVWLSSAEATDLILRTWEWRREELDKRYFIRPDARLGIRDRRYWIEYDNDTEGARKLERKFHGYVHLNDSTPVVWVAPNEKRRDYLQTLWKNMVKAFYSNHQSVPKMYFFVAGNETSFLVQEETEAVPV